MDHRAFLTALDPEVRARLSTRSNRAGLIHLAQHLGLIAMSALWVALAPWPLTLPGLVALGICLIFLFTLEHEATHRTPFAHDGLNDWVGRICGFVLILPFEWFRYFHLAHHRWTNIAGRDPELEGEKPETWSAWVWHVSGLPYWISEIRLMGQLVRGRGMADYVPESARARVVAEARWMTLGYAVVALTLVWSPAAVWFWIGPVLLGQPFLRLYLLAEHGDCPRVADMFQNTRTTFTTALVRLLAWNMPYHVEHHVMPAVPFHRLPEVHGLMKDELRVTAAGYAAFTRQYLARRG